MDSVAGVTSDKWSHVNKPPLRYVAIPPLTLDGAALPRSKMVCNFKVFLGSQMVAGSLWTACCDLPCFMRLEGSSDSYPWQHMHSCPVLWVALVASLLLDAIEHTLWSIKPYKVWGLVTCDDMKECSWQTGGRPIALVMDCQKSTRSKGGRKTRGTFQKDPFFCNLFIK